MVDKGMYLGAKMVQYEDGIYHDHAGLEPDDLLFWQHFLDYAG